VKRFLRSSHRYISLLVSIQLLLWTVSGIFFAFNKIEKVRGEHVIERGAIHANLADFTTQIEAAQSVRLASRLGEPILIVSKAEGVNYVNRAQQSVPMLEPEEAKSAVASGTKLTPREVEILHTVEAGDEYRGRRLPLYRVTADDQGETFYNVYVNPYSSEIVAVRSLKWRIWDLMWGLHIMDWQARDDIHNWPMKVFSVFALISALSGVWLFFASKSRS